MEAQTMQRPETRKENDREARKAVASLAREIYLLTVTNYQNSGVTPSHLAVKAIDNAEVFFNELKKKEQ